MPNHPYTKEHLLKFIIPAPEKRIAHLPEFAPITVVHPENDATDILKGVDVEINAEKNII